MRLLVTGATGLIGGALLARLEDVAILSRSPGKVAGRLPLARVFSWDPMAGPPPAEAFEGVDVVVNLAGEPIADGAWTVAKKQKILESRVTGTRNLVAGMAALTERPAVLISGSAVGIYGDRGQEPLDERSEPGTGFLADVCREWETAAMEAGGLGIRVVTVRTGVVLAGRGGALERIMKPFRAGLGGRLGNGTQWMPWIHVNDVAGLMLHAASNTEINGPMNAVAPQPVQNREFTRQLGQVLGRPAVLSVPAVILRIAMGEMSTVLTDSQRVSPQVAQRTGYAFEYHAIDVALMELIGRH